MRQDQLEKLASLQERIADVFLDEAEPDKWPSLDTAVGRGDRYWLKKNASASLAIMLKLENLLGLRQGRVDGAGAPIAADEPDLEKEIRDAEKQTEKLINMAEHRRKKRA
jgi:hypothetical protein